MRDHWWKKKVIRKTYRRETHILFSFFFYFSFQKNEGNFIDQLIVKIFIQPVFIGSHSWTSASACACCSSSSWLLTSVACLSNYRTMFSFKAIIPIIRGKVGIDRHSSIIVIIGGRRGRRRGRGGIIGTKRRWIGDGRRTLSIDRFGTGSWRTRRTRRSLAILRTFSTIITSSFGLRKQEIRINQLIREGESP